MKKLVVLMLAASALAPASAIAQRTAAPPLKWEDTPHAKMRAPMAPPVAAAPGPMRHTRPFADVAPAPGAAPVIMPHHGPGAAPAHKRDRVIVRHHGGPGAKMRHRGMKNYSGYHRIDRGFALPHAWWGPRYQIHNWSMYGLPQPFHGGRWVRYYDDALLVDGYGRVMDGRWGMSWDQWGDQWGYDDRGVPAYVGNGDFYPGDEDYAWVEEDRRGYGYDQRYADGGCAQACAAPPPPPPGYPYGHGYGSAYGHGYGSAYGRGYGWGWGYGGAVVVTETTVTTAPTVVTETYYEEEVVSQRRATKPRKYRAKPRYHRPAPPPPGERG